MKYATAEHPRTDRDLPTANAFNVAERRRGMGVCRSISMVVAMLIALMTSLLAADESTVKPASKVDKKTGQVADSTPPATGADEKKPAIDPQSAAKKAAAVPGREAGSESTANPPQQAKTAPAEDSSASKPRSALKLRKKGSPEANEPKQSRPRPSSEDKQPPAEATRPIPKPDGANPERSDLDKQLLEELGADMPPAEEEETDPLMRAGKRMRAAEEKLARLEATDETVTLQQKAIEDIEELLKQARNPQQKPKSKKSQKNKNQQQQQQNAEQQRMMSRVVEKQSTREAQGVGRAQPVRPETNRPPETKDVWGHLGDALRDEMSQYAKESFLPKYREMLEKYYTTIAEQSRKRGE